MTDRQANARVSTRDTRNTKRQQTSYTPPETQLKHQMVSHPWVKEVHHRRGVDTHQHTLTVLLQHLVALIDHEELERLEAEVLLLHQLCPPDNTPQSQTEQQQPAGGSVEESRGGLCAARLSMPGCVAVQQTCANWCCQLLCMEHWRLPPHQLLQADTAPPSTSRMALPTCLILPGVPTTMSGHLSSSLSMSFCALMSMPPKKLPTLTFRGLPKRSNSRQICCVRAAPAAAGAGCCCAPAPPACGTEGASCCCFYASKHGWNETVCPLTLLPCSACMQKPPQLSHHCC